MVSDVDQLDLDGIDLAQYMSSNGHFTADSSLHLYMLRELRQLLPEKVAQIAITIIHSLKSYYIHI